jgi:hypothetical protein
MFKRGIFVPALIGIGESPMQQLFEVALQHAGVFPPYTMPIGRM